MLLASYPIVLPSTQLLHNDKEYLRFAPILFFDSERCRSLSQHASTAHLSQHRTVGTFHGLYQQFADLRECRMSGWTLDCE